MSAGKLKYKITIQQRSTPGTQDSVGQPVDAWLDFATRIWADVLFLSGKEFIKSDREGAEASASIKIRRRPGITPAMRVIHHDPQGDVIYNISAVLPDTEKDYIFLAVTTGNNEG